MRIWGVGQFYHICDRIFILFFFRMNFSLLNITIPLNEISFQNNYFSFIFSNCNEMSSKIVDGSWKTKTSSGLSFSTASCFPTQKQTDFDNWKHAYTFIIYAKKNNNNNNSIYHSNVWCREAFSPLYIRVIY